MRRIYSCFPLLLFVGLFPPSRTEPGKVLPPRNLTARWEDDFNFGVTWEPPQHSAANCCYHVSLKFQISLFYKTVHPHCGSSWSFPGVMTEGVPVLCSVATVCDGVRSEPAILNFSPPELVRNLTCFLSSVATASCQWTPGRALPDLRFFYKLSPECVADSAMSFPSDLQECPSYRYANGGKTGCDLEGTKCHVVKILVNGTLENQVVRHTYERNLKDDVRLRPLTWDVAELGNVFNISWTPPEVTLPDNWIFKINYTECGETKNPIGDLRKTSYELERVSRCRYEIAIRAETPRGLTAWSEWRHFESNVSNALVYATIIVPMVFGILAFLTCVAFHRNKDKIFPRIPEPKIPLAFPTLSPVSSMYMPEEEEEGCKVTEVFDPADC